MTLIGSLRALGAGYGRWASALAPSPERRKLLAAYAAGLTGATAGLHRLADTYYRSRTSDERTRLDALASASGIPEMLASAREILASEPLQDQAALVAAAAWFRKTHRVIRDVVTPPGPGQAPGPDVLRPIPWIESLIENIGRLVAREFCLIEITLLRVDFLTGELDYPVKFRVQAAVGGEVRR